MFATPISKLIAFYNNPLTSEVLPKPTENKIGTIDFLKNRYVDACELVASVASQVKNLSSLNKMNQPMQSIELEFERRDLYVSPTPINPVGVKKLISSFNSGKSNPVTYSDAACTSAVEQPVQETVEFYNLEKTIEHKLKASELIKAFESEIEKHEKKKLSEKKVLKSAREVLSQPPKNYLEHLTPLERLNRIKEERFQGRKNSVVVGIHLNKIFSEYEKGGSLKPSDLEELREEFDLELCNISFS
jgi:hypothetical protein